MSNFENDIFTVLNYQGSKKRLLEFIYNNIYEYLYKDKAILDICTGTASVAYGLKRYNKIYANDSEIYAATIAEALLKFKDKDAWEKEKDQFIYNFKKNYDNLNNNFRVYVEREQEALELLDVNLLKELYNDFPTIWSGKQIEYNNKIINNESDLRKLKNELPFMLFTTYYSTTYFGLKQSIEIDSIRYSIENIKCKHIQSMLLTSLYFSMKECIFSKDGHMAQPLNIDKDSVKLINLRVKSIYKIFINKVEEFLGDKFLIIDKDNKIFNMELTDIIKQDEIKKSVGFIYADPPYTDMQYSRYYHLLNTVTLYDYDDISLNRGVISKGLYRKQRFQSPLSKRSEAFNQTKLLFEFCKENKIDLGLSFAYPRDPKNQPTDRYTMNIDDIIKLGGDLFGNSNIEVLHEEYEHSNNRNSSAKKVLEYLIICKN